MDSVVQSIDAPPGTEEGVDLPGSVPEPPAGPVHVTQTTTIAGSKPVRQTRPPLDPYLAHNMEEIQEVLTNDPDDVKEALATLSPALRSFAASAQMTPKQWGLFIAATRASAAEEGAEAESEEEESESEASAWKPESDDWEDDATLSEDEEASEADDEASAPPSPPKRARTTPPKPPAD